MKSKRYKILSESGVSTLCNYVKANRKLAEKSGTAVSTLADTVELTVKEIESILNNKQDISAVISFTIPVTGWKSDASISSYPQYYEVAVPGLLETDVVEVTVSPTSSRIALEAGFTLTQSFDGRFRLRAISIPAQAILAQYRVIRATI